MTKNWEPPPGAEDVGAEKLEVVLGEVPDRDL
jgi:hypothetical protein